MPIEIGLFDWIDQRAAPVRQIYAERLRLLEDAEAAGFAGYHLAEHHATPLSLAPSPGIFLAAAAQRTSRIRLGPLVYLLPLYNPLRLLKEIAMLDQLSGGRLEVGIGRGVSPYELRYFGIDPGEARAIFNESLEVLRAGLTARRLTHHGKYFQFDDVPIEIHPLQEPYPAFWYPTSNLESVPWAAREGLHLMGQSSIASLRAAADRYRAVWAEHRTDPTRINAHVADPRIGVLRLVYVAPTDAEAEADARIAHRDWFANFIDLWRAFGDPAHAERGDYDGLSSADGSLIVGSPDTVQARLTHLIEATTCNYLVLAFHWGSLDHERARRSLRLFAGEVLPGLPDGAAPAPAAAG